MKVVSWGSTLLAIFTLSGLLLLTSMWLPDNEYQRFQFVRGTVHADLEHVYERINFDARPIDVAIIGSSRTMLGLSSRRIEKHFLDEGKHISVANLSNLADGRNLEWIISEQLYRQHHPRALVVMITEDPPRFGHEMFKYVAPASEIVFPPSPRLYDYIPDLSYLPFRQSKLFVAQFVPRVFALDLSFNPAAYARQLDDQTVSHRSWSGRWIDMIKVNTAPALRAQRIVEDHPMHAKIPARVMSLFADDEMTYLPKIVRIAQSHGSAVVFVYLPHFEGSTTIKYRTFYAHIGPIVSLADLANDNRVFEGWNHLNRAGALIASDRVAKALDGAL